MSNYVHPLAQYWEQYNCLPNWVTMNEGFWFEPKDEDNFIQKPITPDTSVFIDINDDCYLIQSVEHYAGTTVYPIKPVFDSELEMSVAIATALLICFDAPLD